jgi:RNA polymerase sigma-70 factor, ECF subfamily
MDVVHSCIWWGWCLPSFRTQPGVPFGLQATTARAGQMQKGHLGTASRSDAPPVPADRADSFEAFFVDHHADLFGALYLVTRNRHEAEEITQDAFLKVLERWDRVSLLADPVGYLYRTAMNLFRKRWRRASFVLRRTVGLNPRDDEIAVIETRVDVARALASLSPRQRAAVVLTELLEFSSEEAGRMLGIAPGTVRMHASRGRAALADILGGAR